MGSIYKRGSKYWLKYQRAGRVYRESSRSTDYRKARRLLALREGAIAKGEPVSPQLNKVSFEDAVADVKRDYRINQRRSLAAVECRVRLHLSPAFAGRRLADLTAADFRHYMDARREAGGSVASVNRELAIVKRAFTLAHDAGLVTVNPRIPTIAEHNARQGFFEPAQVDALIRHLPAPVQPVIRFAFGSGWRIASEVLPLEWKHVDEAAGVITLPPGSTKNRDGRTLVYGELAALCEVIEAQARERDRLRKAGRICPYVFHRDGERIRDFYHAWHTACRKAGCPGRIPHDLRRSAVRVFVRAGVSEHTAMGFSGHRSVSVFRRYDIVSLADQRAAAARVNRYLQDARESGSRAAAGEGRTSAGR